MNIGFDAKRIFHNATGLGNYGRFLINILEHYYPKNVYHLYNPLISSKKLYSDYPKENKKMVLPSGFWKFFPALWRIYGINYQIKKDKIDIYHGLTGELPFGIHKSSIKKIVTIHDLIFIRNPQLYDTISRNIYLKKAKYSVKVADIIVAISQQTKEDLVNLLGVNEEKIKIIYQGCHKVFKSEFDLAKKKSLLREYNIPEKFILNVGTIEARKNALSIVKAIRNIDITLVLVGKKKEHAREIEQYLHTSKIHHKVIFIEYLTSEELAILYQEAKLFVFPSFFEGFGIPILEAIYSKTPVITSHGSCFHEVGGPHSIYIDPNNVDELRKQILFLLENPNARKKQAEQSLEYARRFDDEVIAKQYMDLYHLFLSKP